MLSLQQDLARVYLKQRKYDLALPLCVRCLERQTVVLGRIHATTLATLNLLGAWRGVSKAHHHLLTHLLNLLYQHTILTHSRIPPISHFTPHLLPTGSLHEQQGHYQEALLCYQECLDSRQTLLGTPLH